MRRLACLIWLLALGSCGYHGRAAAPYKPPPAAVERGEGKGAFLYRRDCGWCHGDRGEGTRNGPGLRGGSNGPALTDFMLRTGRMPLASRDARMRRQTSRYDEAEIAALVDEVQALTSMRDPKVPRVRFDRNMIGHGGELYLENCAACHSTTGVGGSMTQGRFPGPVRRETSAVAPGLASATPVEIAEAIRTGPGAMPVFGKGVLNDSDVDAIVTYVRYIQRPSDRGGSSIGRIGPVAEGAVGWIVGLGLLLVLSRWIGTRAET